MVLAGDAFLEVRVDRFWDDLYNVTRLFVDSTFGKCATATIIQVRSGFLSRDTRGRFGSTATAGSIGLRFTRFVYWKPTGGQLALTAATG